MKFIPFPAIWSSWFLWGDPSMRFFVHSSASKMQAYFVLQSFFNATSFPVLLTLKFAKRCGWHRNFQVSTRSHHDILEFLIIRINEVNTTQSSGTVELRFFDSPLLLLFAFRRIRHIFPNLWPQSVWSGGRLFSCQCHTRPCISHPVVFHSIQWILWNLSTHLTSLDFNPRSNSRRYFLQHYI